MSISLDLHVNAHTPTPIPPPGAEPRTDIIEGGRVPRVPAAPGTLNGVGFTLGPVGRAIEDLQRSGYRPLHVTPGRAGALVDHAGAPRFGAPGVHGEAKVI